MAFLPSELIGGDLEWLLDFVVKDATLHFARLPMEAEFGDDVIFYKGGLEFSEEVEDSINPFGSSPSSRSVDITLHASIVVDVVTEISRGYDLAAARGRLWLYERNTDTAVLFLDGVVRGVEFGGTEEPITFTLEEAMADDAGLFPPARAVINDDSWPNHAEECAGARYPWVFGQPGYHYDTDSWANTHGYSYPVCQVDTTASAQKVLVAGHHVEATHVIVICDQTGLYNRTAVTNGVDGNLHPVATADLAAIAIGSGALGVPEDEDTFFCKFHVDGGGLMKPNGSMMSGAGDILRFMLGFSTMRIDHGRVAAATLRLNQYRIDAAVVCPPEERFSPWSWINDHLSPILPVSWRVSVGDTGGFYPVVWPFDTTSHDSVTSIVATAEPRFGDTPSLSESVVVPSAFRVGRASFSRRDDVANHISVSFMSDLREGVYWGTSTLSAEPEELTSGRAGSNLYCHASRTRYRDARNLPQTVPMELTSDVIWEPGTANSILSWRSRKHALQAVTASYVVDAEKAGHLEPGDVLLLTDEELAFTEYLFVVEQITWRADRFLSLDLRSLVDAARDMAGAEGEEHG